MENAHMVQVCQVQLKKFRKSFRSYEEGNLYRKIYQLNLEFQNLKMSNKNTENTKATMK